jgi:penicillin-binding protein 1A
MPLPPPPGIKLIRVNLRTGQRAGPDNPKAILEAFTPGTAPPDNSAAIAMSGAPGGPGGPDASAGVSPEANRAVRTGGGLY